MSRVTIIQCNGCGKRLRGHRHWPRRRDLHRLGWKVPGDDTHYCPECAMREEGRDVTGSRNQTCTDLP